MENEIVAFFMTEAFYLVGFSAVKSKTKRFIKHLGINFKFYPKHYILPNRLFRKIFELKKEKIPKHLYFSLWFAFALVIMAFVAPILFLVMPMAAIASVVVCGVLYSLDVLMMYIISIVFERR